MIFWLLAISLTVAACAALYYAAAGGTVNASPAGAATEAHFRLQLSEIEADMADGQLGAAEGIAAKAELARELLRARRERSAGATQALVRPWVLPASLLAVVAIAFGSYAYLGRPGLPSQPLAGRTTAATADGMSIDAAVKAVETRLAQNPDDIRGWQVIGPVYMQAGRYADAEKAYRRVLALAPPTADAETDLAEALMMQNGGQANGEAADLLNKAAALDAHAVRPRFYLAAEAMRRKDYASAVAQWNDIVGLGTDADPWMATAKAGLAAAEAGRDGKPLPGAAGAAAGAAQSAAIQNMVSGLSDRLYKAGGSLEQWTQLVRSEIVLGDMSKAQAAYDAAKKAYPDSGARAGLDGLAAQAGLKLDGGSP